MAKKVKRLFRICRIQMAGPHAQENSCLQAEKMKAALAIDNVMLKIHDEMLAKAGASPEATALPEITPLETNRVPVATVKCFTGRCPRMRVIVAPH